MMNSKKEDENRVEKAVKALNSGKLDPRRLAKYCPDFLDKQYPRERAWTQRACTKANNDGL